MKKRFLSVLLCLCMVMTLLPVTAGAAEHQHRSCGSISCSQDHDRKDNGADCTDSVEWTEINSTNYGSSMDATHPNGLAPMKFSFRNSGYYYLSEDSDLNNINIHSGATDYICIDKDIWLCLNGYTLSIDRIDINNNCTLHICNCRGEGKINTCLSGFAGNLVLYSGEIHATGAGRSTIEMESPTSIVTMYGGTVSYEIGGSGYGAVTLETGTFNMYGGKITGQSNSIWAGGVTVEGGTFNMAGGSIRDCQATLPESSQHVSAGGVKLAGGTFNMTGGSITGNTAVSAGAGVHVASGTFSVSGNVQITNNKANGEANNVYLPSGESITVNGNLDSNARIGVSIGTALNENTPNTVIAQRTGNAVSEDNFTKDDTSLDAQFIIDSTTVKLGKPTYTVTFDSKGGTAVAAQNIISGGKATEPSPAPTKDNHTFAGWYKEAELTNKWIFNTNTVSAPTTLYAKWTPHTYGVTFHTNGGTINDGNVQNYTYGAGATLPTEVTRTGYTFDGWYANSDLTGDAVTVIGNNESGVKKYWAKWNINQYTITFDSDGGSGVASITQDYNTAVTPPSAPTREGYTFAGWDPAIPGTMPAENKTHTAKWNPIPAESPTVATNGNLNLTYGYDAGSISVTATADAGTAYTLSYQWYCCDADGNSGEAAPNATDSDTYIIPTGKNAGTYYYYCAVTSKRTDNNRTATTNSGVITVSVAKKNITITGATVDNKPYDGNNTANVTAVTFDGTIAALAKGPDYTVTGTFPDANADTGNVDVAVSVTLIGDALTNYSLAEATYTATAAAKITKIDHSPYGIAQSGDTSAIKSVPGEKTYTLPCSELDGVVYAVTGKTTANIVDDVAPTIAGNTLTYTSKVYSGDGNPTDTITVKISSTNYNDITFTLTVTAANKQTVSISDVEAATGLIYDGTAKIGYTGTLSCDQGWNANELTTTYYLADGTTKTNVDNSGAEGEGLAPKKAGSYKVTFAVPESSDTYTGSLTLQFTIEKATLTVTAKDQSIYTGGTAPDLSSPVLNTHYTVAGLVGSDTLGGTITMEYQKDSMTAIPDTSTTGSYDIVISGATVPGGGNYNEAITFTKGTLTINTKPNSSGGYTPPSYKITERESADERDGSVSFSTDKAKKGDTVTITVTPDAFYKVDKVIVKDIFGNIIEVTANEDGTFSFKMPFSNVTVEPIFSWDNPFADVTESTYYAPAVEWALKSSITTGSSSTAFSPDASCTRAQMATFLWRAAGSPEPTDSTSPFTDVSADAYYAKAVQWAYEQKITGGTSDTTFSPNAVCTRAQMATFLWRNAVSPMPEGDTNPFTDVTADAYYTKAIQWAYEQKITGGTSDTTFSPDAPCARGQMVTFLYRYFEE